MNKNKLIYQELYQENVRHIICELKITWSGSFIGLGELGGWGWSNYNQKQVNVPKF